MLKNAVAALNRITLVTSVQVSACSSTNVPKSEALNFQKSRLNKSFRCSSPSFNQSHEFQEINLSVSILVSTFEVSLYDVIVRSMFSTIVSAFLEHLLYLPSVKGAIVV